MSRAHSFPMVQRDAAATGALPKLEQTASFSVERAPPCFSPGGLGSSVYLLSAMSLGVGVFAMPNVMNQCGWALGGLLLAFFGITSTFTSGLCLRSASQVGALNYEDLARTSLGKVGHAYYCIAMAITAFIGNCAHVQAVTSLFGDTLIWFVTDTSTLDAGEWHLETYKQALLISLLLAVSLPYCFQQNIGALHWIGTATVITVSLTVLMFSGYCILLSAGAFPHDGGYEVDVVPAFNWSAEGIFRASGTICFAYTSLTALFPVLGEMNNTKQAPLAIGLGSCTCFVIYLATALAGAWTFGAATQSNCIYNVLPADRGLFRIPIMGLVVFITLLYPIVNFPMVVAIESLVGSSRYSRAIISTVGAMLVVVVDMCVPDIGDLFGLCGSLGLGSIVYVIPCAIFLRTDPSPYISLVKLGTLFTLAAGLLVTFVSTFFVCRHILTGK